MGAPGDGAVVHGAGGGANQALQALGLELGDLAPQVGELEIDPVIPMVASAFCWMIDRWYLPVIVC